MTFLTSFAFDIKYIFLSLSKKKEPASVTLCQRLQASSFFFPPCVFWRENDYIVTSHWLTKITQLYQEEKSAARNHSNLHGNESCNDALSECPASRWAIACGFFRYYWVICRGAGWISLWDRDPFWLCQGSSHLLRCSSRKAASEVL